MKTLQSAALLCAALALLLSAHSAAQHRMYKCVDDKGRVYYTQVPPKECLGRETQELSRQGTVTKSTGGALTPEQEAAREEQRKKELDAEKEFYLKKPVPPKLAQDIKNNETEIKNQRELLEAKKKQVASVNTKYDDEKRRYGELTGGAPASAAKAAAKK